MSIIPCCERYNLHFVCMHLIQLLCKIHLYSETLQNALDNLEQKGGVKFHYYEEAGVKIQDRDLIFQKVFHFPFGSPYFFVLPSVRPAKVHKNLSTYQLPSMMVNKISTLVDVI